MINAKIKIKINKLTFLSKNKIKNISAKVLKKNKEIMLNNNAFFCNLLDDDTIAWNAKSRYHTNLPFAISLILLF